MKDPYHRIEEIHERFRLRIIFACLLLRECSIAFPKIISPFPIVREGETLPHEGKVAVFGVFFPKKFKKTFFPKWGSAQF